MHRIPSPIVSPRPRRARPGASSRKAGSSRMTGAHRRPFEQLEGRVLFAAGDFDTTFGGGDGAVTTDFASTTDFATALVVQNDGKIIVGGSVGNGTNTDDVFGLTRYNADGSLDLSFGGGDGKATIDFGPDADLNNIALAPDGKIVAVGLVDSPSAVWDWAVARFNADGSPDTTFSGDGMVTTDFFGFGDTAYGVDVQGDGKIVVTGYATGVTSQMAVVRYNTNGTLDATFNGTGQQFVDAFGGVDFAANVKVQPDNKLIVVGGSVQPGSYRRFVLARINANGQMDSTFSGDGVASADFGATSFGKDVEILPDGRYVVGGWVDTNPTGDTDQFDFAVARFNSNGTLDPTFGTSSGFTTVPGTNGHVLGDYGLEVQADGKLVLGGTIKDPNYDVNFRNYGAVARFNPNGTIDTTFGTAGLRQFSVPGTTVGDTNINDLELQNDGKMLLAGYLFGASPTDFAVVRLVNDVVPPPATGSVSGVVFNDQDEDGVRDVGEPGLSGWTVYDDANGNGVYDAGGLIVSSADVPKVIETDPGGAQTITSDIVVSNAPATITDINVTLNIQHTWDRDLVISLISPSRQEILLVNQRGSSGNNFTNTVLDDEAANPISAGLPPFSGSFRPEQALSELDGTNPNGTWTLRIQDVETGEGGSLDSWSITIGTPGEASTLTTADGSYTLSNLAAGSHTIREVVRPGWTQTTPASSGGHAVTIVENQTVTGRNFGNVNRVIAATVTGRNVFYNNSGFDGNNPAADAQDDAAVATNKQALRPGQAATIANVTSYSRGINGVMIDMTRMPSDLDADDFEFRVGDSDLPGTWSLAPAPVSVTERLGTGTNPAMRVSIVWADGAIRNTWLQVTVRANADTRLNNPDVFYFGNLVGETVATAGATSFTVNTSDLLATRRAHTLGGAATAAVTSPADHNRDRRVNVLDEVLVRSNMGNTLRVLAAPAAASASPFGSVAIAGTTADRRLRLAPTTRSLLA